MYDKSKFYENTIIKSSSNDYDYEGLYVADFETSRVNNIDNDVFVQIIDSDIKDIKFDQFFKQYFEEEEELEVD